MQVLGAFFFALAAFDAGIGLHRQGGIICFRLTLFFVLLVQQSKDFGDGDAGRTAVHAVAAGGAGNTVLT